MRRLREWFDDTANWWALAGLATGVFLFGQAVYLNRWTIQGWPRPSLGAAIVGLAFGIAVIARQRWARWVGVAWFTLLAVVQIINDVIGGWDWNDLLGLAVLPLMAAGFYWVFFRKQPDEEDDSKPFLSLVLLCREPRYLDATILARLASQAWGVEVTASNMSDDDDSPEEGADAPAEDDGERGAFIVGQPPIFMAMHPQAMCAIHHFDRPYFDDVDEAAEGIVELRTRQAVRDHRAWLSIDVLHWFGDDEIPDQAYRLIARLLAEIADDNVLAVLDPDAGQVFCYDPEMERKLRSENPLAELREGYYVPIIGISDDDPELQAAVAEARRRWPEFVAAFEARSSSEDDHYSVKAPFGDDDNVEFMWVEVTAIERETIFGTLANDPANIPSLTCGDRVQISVAKLSDWIVVVDGEMTGGFSLKVIEKRAGEGGQSGQDQDD
jgi:uncharacterized protein YegJ (DUF2314 family)